MSQTIHQGPKTISQYTDFALDSYFYTSEAGYLNLSLSSSWVHVLQQSDALVNLLFRPEQHHSAACFVALPLTLVSGLKHGSWFILISKFLPKGTVCVHIQREKLRRNSTILKLCFSKQHRFLYPFFFTVVLQFHLSLLTPGQCGEPEDSVQIFSVWLDGSTISVTYWNWWRSCTQHFRKFRLV